MGAHRSYLSQTTIRGSIPSQKSSRHMVHYRGGLQRAYVYLLEYDDHVQSYEQQPLSLSYVSGKQVAQYTPDFRVIWKHQRPRLVACLPTAIAHKPASLASITAAQLWCQQHAHDFALVTEATLHAQSMLLANLEMLAVHAFAPIPPQTYDYVLKTIIAIGGPFSSLEFVQQTPLLDPLSTKSALWNLLYHGELLADLTQPLQFTTPLLWKEYHPSPGPSSPQLDTAFP